VQTHQIVSHAPDEHWPGIVRPNDAAKEAKLRGGNRCKDGNRIRQTKRYWSDD